jgi:hypothetical protein
MRSLTIRNVFVEPTERVVQPQIRALLPVVLDGQARNTGSHRSIPSGRRSGRGVSPLMRSARTKGPGTVRTIDPGACRSAGITLRSSARTAVREGM